MDLGLECCFGDANESAYGIRAGDAGDGETSMT